MTKTIKLSDFAERIIPPKEYFNLFEASIFKAIPLPILYKNPEIQPNRGKEEITRDGLRLWSRDTILDWILGD